MSVKFEDYSIEVKAAIEDCIDTFLYEAAELLKGQAAQLTRVRTGQLKGSWDYVIKSGAKKAEIGSPLENAIWNEFGTGEYALHGDGRKGGWYYKDEKGKWHHTYGKKPRRTLQTAFNACKASIIRRAEAIFKDGLK